MLLLPTRITDFGTSRTTIKEATVNLTKGLGTPQYMAPEILKGEGNNRYANKVDVYSFGILTYEVLSGCDPYDNSKFSSYFEIADYIISGNVNEHQQTHAHTYLLRLLILFATEARGRKALPVLRLS